MRGDHDEPPLQRTFEPRLAAQPSDEPEPETEAADDLAGPVKVGLLVGQALQELELLPIVRHVPDANEAVHPTGRLGDGPEVGEGVERGLAAVRAPAGIADAAKGNRVHGAVEVGVVEGGAARGHLVEDC